jgi:hypothetical protein
VYGLDVSCGASPLNVGQVGVHGLRIDGGPAYPPGERFFGFGGADVADNPGVLALQLGPVVFDPRNGDLAVTETDPLVRCAPTNTLPVTSDGCRTFAPVPVRCAVRPTSRAVRPPYGSSIAGRARTGARTGWT